MATQPALSEADVLAETGKDHGRDKPFEDDMEGSLEEVDPIAEAKLVRKLDLYIIPVVMLLYLLSFLDR